MDSNAPVAPVKKKVPILLIAAIIVAIAIVIGIVLLVINSTKTAKSEALTNAYADCVSIFYDDGKTPNLRAKAESDQKLAEKVNNTKSWLVFNLAKSPKKYRNYDTNGYAEKILSCSDNLKKAYDELWQKDNAAKTRIDAFNKYAVLYVDYLKINLTEETYYNFYIAHDNSEVLNDYKNKMNEATDSATRMSYYTLIGRFENEKKYVDFLSKKKCFVNFVINRDCVNQFVGSQAYGNVTARKNVSVSSMQRELDILTNNLISSLKMIGDIL